MVEGTPSLLKDAILRNWGGAGGPYRGSCSTRSYETPRIAEADVRPKCANSILVRAFLSQRTDFPKVWLGWI